MPSKTGNKGRVEQVERGQEILRREVESLRRELAAHGVRVPAPAPGRKPPLGEEARRAVLVRAAAKARAAKVVGGGRGAVNDPETAQRLREEAASILGEAVEPETAEGTQGES